MDVVSHGLWGGIAFGRRSKKTYLWAFLIGVLPDLFSFGVFFVHRILIRVGLLPQEAFARFSPPDSPVPLYVYNLYNITHSLIVFGVVFLLVWLMRKKPFLPLTAWGLHVLMDIPVHSFKFFPTPFLWPISDFKVDGISWGNPIIFFPNVALLVMLYGWYFYRKRKEKYVYLS